MDNGTKELIDRLFAQQLVLILIVQELAAKTGCEAEIAQKLRAVGSVLRTHDAAISIDPVRRALLSRLGGFASPEQLELAADALEHAFDLGKFPLA